MATSSPSQTPKLSKTHIKSSNSKALEPQISSEPVPNPSTEKDPETLGEEEEEEGDCGLCLFMKGGECRERFVAWQKCSDENKDDYVGKCFEVSWALIKCMKANSDYYAPFLQAEEAEVEAMREKEKEREVAKEEKVFQKD